MRIIRQVGMQDPEVLAELPDRETAEKRLRQIAFELRDHGYTVLGSARTGYIAGRGAEPVMFLQLVD